MLRVVFAIVFCLVSAPVSAQTAMPSVRIAVGVNVFVPAPAEPDALRVQEEARRKIYQTAARECAVLVETLASDCRLESLNLHANRQMSPQQIEGVQVGGNMNYRITAK